MEPEQDSGNIKTAADQPEAEPEIHGVERRGRRGRGARAGLFRSLDDRYVAGVLGGFAERFNIDSTILRVAVAAIAVALAPYAPWLVPLLYTVGWITIPEPGRRSLLLTISSGRSLREIFGAIALAIVVSTALVLPWIVPFLAGAAWILLTPPRFPPSDDDVSAVRPLDADRSPGDDHGPGDHHSPVETASVASPTSSVETDPAQWGRVRRGVTRPLPGLSLTHQRSESPREPALWPLTAALLMAWIVACITLDRLLNPGLDPAWFVDGSLIIIGAVLALSAWRGRAGWTLLFVVPLIPLWIAFSALDIGRYAGQGSRTVTIESPPEDGSRYVELGYGSLTVDVDEAALRDDEPLKLNAAVTAGTLTVRVPDWADVIMTTRSGWAKLSEVSVRVSYSSQVVGVASNTWRARSTQCSTWSVDGDQLQREFVNWSNVHGLYNDGQAIDFNNRETFDLVTTPVNAYDAAWVSTPIGPNSSENLPAFYFERYGVTPYSVSESDQALIWNFATDQYSGGCDPTAPADPTGTIQIDAKIGLGEVRVERY